MEGEAWSGACPRLPQGGPPGRGWGARIAGLWGARSGPQGLAFCVGGVGLWAIKTGKTGHLFHLF